MISRYLPFDSEVSMARRLHAESCLNVNSLSLLTNAFSTTNILYMKFTFIAHSVHKAAKQCNLPHGTAICHTCFCESCIKRPGGLSSAIYKCGTESSFVPADLGTKVPMQPCLQAYPQTIWY